MGTSLSFKNISHHFTCAYKIPFLFAFRTILLSEHSDVVFLGVLAVLFKTGNPGPIKVSMQCCCLKQFAVLLDLNNLFP